MVLLQQILAIFNAIRFVMKFSYVKLLRLHFHKSSGIFTSTAEYFVLWAYLLIIES